MTMIWYQGPY